MEDLHEIRRLASLPCGEWTAGQIETLVAIARKRSSGESLYIPPEMKPKIESIIEYLSEKERMASSLR